MGLDNIPLKYPCRTQGTATVTPDDAVDCSATQQNGGCPWANATNRPDDGRVLGMLGTDCWYRGAHGENILDVLDVDRNNFSFYGDNEDGTVKSATSCQALSDEIERAQASIDDADLTRRLAEHNNDSTPADFRAHARYAAWWMNWAGKEAGGASCWY